MKYISDFDIHEQLTKGRGELGLLVLNSKTSCATKQVSFFLHQMAKRWEVFGSCELKAMVLTFTNLTCDVMYADHDISQ
jgi:hypothetical protein